MAAPVSFPPRTALGLPRLCYTSASLQAMENRCYQTRGRIEARTGETDGKFAVISARAHWTKPAVLMHSVVESDRKRRRGNEVVRGDRMRAILIR
jgi:hypothetical protein